MIKKFLPQCYLFQFSLSAESAMIKTASDDCFDKHGTTTYTYYPAYAEVIWEWMQQFSRDTTTHEVIYKPAS